MDTHFVCVGVDKQNRELEITGSGFPLLY